MTIYTGSIAQKRITLEAAADEASAAFRRLDAERHTARTHTDPHLSPTGLANEVQKRVAAIEAAAAATVTRLREAATDARDYLARVLDAERPRIADYARAQASWAQALMYLDNGHTLRHVLRNANEALTLAVEEFGPHWLRSQADPAKVWELRFTADVDPVEARVHELQTAVMERLADVTSNPPLADVIRGNLEAVHAIAAAEPWWRGLDAVAAGRTYNGLHAAAERRMADQFKVSQLSEAAPQVQRSA